MSVGVGVGVGIGVEVSVGTGVSVGGMGVGVWVGAGNGVGVGVGDGSLPQAVNTKTEKIIANRRLTPRLHMKKPPMPTSPSCSEYCPPVIEGRLAATSDVRHGQAFPLHSGLASPDSQPRRIRR